MFNPILEYVRQSWSSSRTYRRILTVTAIYAVLRLLLQFLLVSGALFPGEDAAQALPDDLRIYLESSQHLRNQQPLYPPLPLERMEFYQYSPAFALVFSPFLWLSPGIAALIHTLLRVIIYALLYISWGRIFQRLSLPRANETLAFTLPVWLVFSTFWGDMGYLNVYIFMALLATLLIDSVLSKNVSASVLWLSIIIQIKPQWAFAAALPLLLGNYRFFLKLFVFAIASYAAIAVVTLLLVGINYGLEQYTSYFHLLTGISTNYPWRTPDLPYLGYNHSIMQTAVYLLGAAPEVIRLATVTKFLILTPLAIVVLRFILPPRENLTNQTRLDIAFALYLAAFIWLDVVWELALGIAVFTYLLATTSDRRTKIILWALFLPYALVDFWQIASFMIFGEEVVAPGPYILTDPSIYLPIIMIVTLAFYAILVRRIWLVMASRTSPDAQIIEGDNACSPASTSQA